MLLVRVSLGFRFQIQTRISVMNALHNIYSKPAIRKQSDTTIKLSVRILLEAQQQSRDVPDWPYLWHFISKEQSEEDEETPWMNVRLKMETLWSARAFPPAEGYQTSVSLSLSHCWWTINLSMSFRLLMKEALMERRRLISVHTETSDLLQLKELNNDSLQSCFTALYIK